MALAVRAADVRALGWAVLAMVILILAVDALFWRPLVAWAEKFKVEESPAAEAPTSRVLELLRRSHLVPWIEGRLARLDEQVDRRWRRWFGDPGAERPERRRWDGPLTALLWTAIGGLVLRRAAFVTTEVAGAEVAGCSGSAP